MSFPGWHAFELVAQTVAARGSSAAANRVGYGTGSASGVVALPAVLRPNSMFYAFLLIVALAGIGIYVTPLLHLVPGAAEDRLGVLEELPPDVGIWKSDESSPEGVAAAAKGLRRQVRILHQPSAGWLGGERLLHQVRYRDRTTDEIVRVDPERVMKRRRVKR